jgi:charged multivesicular body protein 2A
MIDKAIRELDRERIGLQNQEKKLVVEIKNAAKEGHIVSTRFTGKTKPGGGKILIPRHHTSQV